MKIFFWKYKQNLQNAGSILWGFWCPVVLQKVGGAPELIEGTQCLLNSSFIQKCINILLLHFYTVLITVVGVTEIEESLVFL